VVYESIIEHNPPNNSACTQKTRLRSRVQAESMLLFFRKTKQNPSVSSDGFKFKRYQPQRCILLCQNHQNAARSLREEMRQRALRASR
jgi:hypothetical protein